MSNDAEKQLTQIYKNCAAAFRIASSQSVILEKVTFIISPEPPPPLAPPPHSLCTIRGWINVKDHAGQTVEFLTGSFRKKFLTCFTVFPFVVVGAGTIIAVVLVVRHACSTVLTRPTDARGLQRNRIANLFTRS